MPNYGSITGYWCILRDSHKLRELVKFKISQTNKAHGVIAKEAGLVGYRLSKYLHNKRPNLTQFEVVKLCNYLGIEVTLNIKII